MVNKRLMVVDDQTLVREGIKRIVEGFKGIKIVSEARDGLEALELVPVYKPDIILLDIKMPKLNGIETLERLKDLNFNGRVIILSSYSNKEYIINTIKRGAIGYLSKNCRPEDLIGAINNANKGVYLESSLIKALENLDKNLTLGSDLYKLDLLSNREYEILYLIAQGYTNIGIANKLFISEKTVKNHITTIYRKIEVRNRVEAVIFAYNNNLVVKGR